MPVYKCRLSHTAFGCDPVEVSGSPFLIVAKNGWHATACCVAQHPAPEGSHARVHSASRVEGGRMETALVLSSSHVPSPDAFDGEQWDGFRLPAVAKGPQQRVLDLGDDRGASAAECWPGLPAWLELIVELAIDHGAEHLVFHVDGPVVPDLPVWDWADAGSAG